jgi:thiol:disulfide interchange protein DsbA
MRLARTWFFLLLAFTAPAAFSAGTPIAGVDYYELEAGRALPATPEVVEYFWYRCPHCYALEPLLEGWVARLPSGIRFRRIPAVLGKEWLIDARIFYALDALGELPRLHRPFLEAIHHDGGRRLDREAYARWAADWLSAHGLERARYDAAFGSARVAAQAEAAAAQSRGLRLEGTPTFMVAGRYLVSPPEGDRRRILEIVDYLISRVQAEQLARR